jgi:GalNAc-alpha-(1->4)-GalNAc-alpha-(1->3)-diNAcBac-PP-undecaprenol alpha-1,4-N-acetyl-D-galactosaminyltransferase
MKNKEVCFVIHSLQAGGMERVMSELINYFVSQKKYTVHLVLYGIKRDLFYTVSDEVIIHKPKFEFDNSKRLWSTVKTLAFLRKKIKEINPVSLLSFGEKWNNMVLLSLYGTGIPVFVSDRSQPNKTIGRKDEFLRKILYPKAKGVIVQTVKALDIFKTYYKHSNFKVIGNPIRQIQPKDVAKENVILMVGRYIESKQQNVLIEIFSKLNAPDWKLVLLGYDHLKQENQAKWEALADELGVGDRIIFTGKQGDVEQYYLRSKIFAFSSISEGFPNVIGEAMSAGLPVVAFDCVAGPSDLITDGETGFLIPMNNKELFAQKLQLLIDNSELIVNFGNNSKSSITKFELNYICSQFENFIIPLQE